MKKISLLFLISIFSLIFSYKVTFVVYVPDNTPNNSNVFISGNFNDWNPNDKRYMMQYKNGHYELKVDLSGVIKFIVTRGSTTTIENIKKYRIARITKDGVKIIAKVKKWKDLSGKLEIIENFYSPELNNKRNIIVYLPPGYDENEKYPVLYMHDGQNLFDSKTSFIGIEWGIDETLDNLITTGKIDPIIVVGIYNSSDRLAEYSPWYDSYYKDGGKGDKYLEFIVNSLKPFIDSHYSTKKESNYIGGSSMGGLISLYAISKYDIFSGAIVMSPSLFFGDGKIFNYVSQNPPANAKIFLYVGKKESSDPTFLENVRKLERILKKNFVNVKYIEDPEGIHNEVYWAKRFPEAVEWILEVKK
ncbi:alpha/beta hydrolase [Thermosipho atlanticus]|uniref:Predicted hydrolase of the alpha/beta superfamily n=1 Tax=Thermosipho atlanticus DSM 15807 TaxID=1123380 RepID=A0A1M5T0C2_9BACT|nr:alpha/beta hydrolase-fold protein [Thermosipho atlanticus]SHH44112.1 Predicted hydrolase of the alpha/beta superfamily [Thermosipho atlanticus DSM 15807]